MKSTSEGTEREWSHRGARMHRGSGLTGVQECIGGVVSQGCKNA